jgi:hypothetical protein
MARIEAPTSSDLDTDAAFLPTPLRGKRKVKSMRTPGMGAMMGAPRPRGNLNPVGKIEPGALPYAKGGSVSARADGCAIRGKTKGKIL